MQKLINYNVQKLIILSNKFKFKFNYKIYHEIMNKKIIRTCEQKYPTKLNYTWNETSKYIPTKLNYTWNKTSKSICNHQSVHCIVTPKVSQILWIVFIDWVLISSLYTEWLYLQWKQHSMQNITMCKSKSFYQINSNSNWITNYISQWKQQNININTILRNKK